MKKVLLVDDKWLFRQIWMWGLNNEITFLHAATIEQAREIFYQHPDLSAIVVDAHMKKGWKEIIKNIYQGVDWREWGLDTRELIAELKSQFQGPIIASTCQWWQFTYMLEAGCTHYAWKWCIAYWLRELLL